MLDTEALLRRMTDAYGEILGDNLVGVYLHGSLAMGAFHPAQSDVDVLVIVEHELTEEAKRRLASFLIELSADAPPKGIEMSVVLRRYLEAFEYPTPFEFHFGKEHIAKFRAGTMDWNETVRDPDLAAHVVVTRERGRALLGPPPKELFPIVPPEHFFASLMADIEWFGKDIAQNPVYAVLNLCRVLAYAREGRILSKVEGGEWALGAIAEGKPLIERALRAYAPGTRDEGPWDADALHRFLEAMVAEIRRAWSGRKA